MESITDLKETLKHCVAVSCSTNEDVPTFKELFSLGHIMESLKKSFSCVICMDVVTPPVVISCCCKQVLGCNSCCERWFENEDNCPHCRSSECNQIVLNCFDNLINKIQ